MKPRAPDRGMNSREFRRIQRPCAGGHAKSRMKRLERESMLSRRRTKYGDLIEMDLVDAQTRDPPFLVSGRQPIP